MIGVLVSGEGTNLQALIDAGLPIAAVASNRAEAGALARAEEAGIPNRVFDLDSYPDRAALVPCETQAQNDGTYKLRFLAAPGGSGRFEVVPAGQENRPLSVTARKITPLRGGIAYIATGPAQFSAGVQPL